MTDYEKETHDILAGMGSDYSKVSNVHISRDLESVLSTSTVAEEISAAARTAKSRGYSLERFVSDVVEIGFKEGLRPVV